ncbi:hypothetical protein Droror1_Dr00017946 [Drosera rotundifolia]
MEFDDDYDSPNRGLKLKSLKKGQEISVLCRNVVGFLVFIVPGFGSIAMEDTGNDLRKLSESISLRSTGSVEANEKFLLRLKSRLDRVGIDMPKIEVRFEHLEVKAEAYVGSRALPSFLNFTTSIFELLHRRPTIIILFLISFIFSKFCWDC